MNYRLLLPQDTSIRVGLVGAGAFGRAFLCQSRFTPGLDVVAVCDREPDAALAAARASGIAKTSLVQCSSVTEGRNALAAGKTVVADDGRLLADLPLDVVVEATGSPEAGAVHGLAAIEAGKHVVMVTKETAAVVGPILARKAAEAGVVYTTPDGDQPSMCIGLITWAQRLGLEIVCAGKATESDFIYDPAAAHVRNRRKVVPVGHGGAWTLWPTPETGIVDVVRRRAAELTALPMAGIPEYAEMAIVMNNTGIGFDAGTPPDRGVRFQAPVLRMQEIPDVLRPAAEGGLLGSQPVIEVFNCLRRPDEPGMAGGVFVVSRCHDGPTWEMLRRKGHLLSRDGRHAAIYLPYHLLGVETATSVLAAAHLGLPTGGGSVQPVADVGMIATADLPAGMVLEVDSGHALAGVSPRLLPPIAGGRDTPIPYYMAAGNSLQADVPAGTLVTYDMVAAPDDSTLWRLRAEQERMG